MRGRSRHTLLSFWIDLLSCFLLPAYTLLFAGSVEWFGTNFSVIAVTGPEHYRGFFLWGLLASCYYLLVLGGISSTLPFLWQQLLLCALTLLGCTSLGWALAVPYLPEDFPRYADLHVLLAFLACVLLMTAILAALLCCRRDDPLGCRPLFRDWWGIIGVSGLLFLWAGIISTALEVFFTLSTLRLTRRLWILRQHT